MKIFSFITVSVLFLCLLNYRLWLGSGGIISNWHLYAHLHAQHKANIKQQSDNLQLANDINHWKAEEVELVEAYARTHLGMVKPGEIFYQVVNG